MKIICWQSLTHLYASSAEMETLLKMYITKKWKWNNSKMVYNSIIYLNLDKSLVLRCVYMPNTVANSKNYLQRTRTTYFDTSFTVHCFFKPSVTFWHGFPVAHAQSFRVGLHQKLLVFVPNTVKVFLIPWCNKI